MDERTKILISIGAATAANCIPCFEHIYYKAQGVKLDSKEIKEAVDIAAKVKSGAHIALKASINDIMNDEHEQTGSETCACDCV